MAQTIYTSARNVDVRNCEPQPLIKSNYLAEFRTKLEQAKARQNLGIKDDIIWGNITGDLESNIDIINYIAKSLKYDEELSVQQKIAKLQEDLNSIDTQSIQDILDRINNIQGSGQSIENLYQFCVNVNDAIIDSNLELKYNSELSPQITVVNTVGGITSGTKVSDLENKTFHQLFDMILFPKIDPKPISPTLTVNVPRLVAIDSTVDVEIQYTKNNAGDLKYLKYNGETLIENSSDSTIKQTKTISVNDLTPITVDVICEYNDGNPLPDNQGNVTDKKVVAGSLSKNIEIKVTYPWYINGREYVTAIGSTERKIEFTQQSPVIEFPKGSEYTLKADMGAGLNGIVEASWNKEEIDKHGIKYIKLSREWPNPVRHKIEEITIKIGGEQ